MAMSRKNFIAFAATLQRHKPKDASSPEYRVWKAVVRDIAFDCSRDNYNFNYSRFYEACGLED